MVFFVSFFFLLVYLVSTNQLFSFDAVSNAIACEHPDFVRWFHSNHLLYPFLGAVWFRIERLFSYDGYAIYSLARFNSLMAAAGLGVFFQALSLQMDKKKAAVAVFFLGSTYAVWHYAVDGRAIGTTILFSSLLIWFLVRGRRQPFLAAGLSSLYVFSHAIAIFHVAPVSWFIAKRFDRTKAWMYLLGVGGIIAAVYVAVFVAVSSRLSSLHFFSWIIGYAASGGIQNVGNSPFWAQNAGALLTGLWTGWANAFGRHILTHGIAVLFLVGLVVAAVKIKRKSKIERTFFWTLVAWGGLTTLFLAFWSPGQEGFRLHVLVPWAAALFIAFKDSKVFFQTAALAAALLFSLNLSGPIYDNAFIQNNRGYQLLVELQTHLKPTDIVLTGTPDVLPDYEVLRPYFFSNIAGGTLSGWLLVSGQNNFNALAEDFTQKLKQGRTLYWTEDVTNPALQKRLEKTSRLEPGAMIALVSSFETKPAFHLSNGVKVYEVVQTNHKPKQR